MKTFKKSVFFLFILIIFACKSQEQGCPPQELILPCRCSLRQKEFQIWCTHSDLPRVLEGLHSVGQHIFYPIDELILENNNLPSLPGKTFLPLKVMRLMLRNNGLERVSGGWLSGLEDSLMELFIVEPDLRSLPEESLQNLIALEAITIQTNLMKRPPSFSGLVKLRHLQIESRNLVELTPRNFKGLISLEKLHVGGSRRLDRLQAGFLQDLPRISLVNISFCGVSWMHLRAITRLPNLRELILIGNKINDAGMIGRGVRDLPGLEVIRLDHNEIGRLNEADFVDLPNLKKLFLGNNRIVELNRGVFHRVPSLRTLDLNKNNVRRVHPESFLHSGVGLEELYLMNNDINHVAELRSLLDALPRLTFLDMSYNNLEEIPFGALRGHGTLERLHLDFNKLQIIERDAFLSMPALRELRLKNNSLSDRLETPFWNLPALKGLDLSGNFFRRIEPRLLTNAPSLRKIDFSSNDITFIDPNSFSLTPELEQVNLSHNALPTLHPATFRHLLNLFELDISYNELLEFVPGLPRGIEYLHMNKNLITNIPLPPSPDLDLPILKMLDISSNSIETIPQGSLQTLPQLRKLYANKNAFSVLEENSLSGLQRLEHLDLSDNRIAKIYPHALKDALELQELNLRHNRLDLLIPEIFRNLPNLKKLDISKNQLNEILTGTLENSNIEIIHAAHNNLVNFPPLYSMKNLRALDLTNNRLKNLHPDSLKSEILEDLRLSHNFLQQLQRGAFSNMPNLKILSLDNNELVEIQNGAIRALPSLKLLKLNQNQLRELPTGALTDLQTLQICELQENQLRALHPNAFQKIPHLLMLNLSGNHLEGIEDAGLKNLRSLEMLDLSDNRIGAVGSPTLEKMEWLVELRMDDNKICSVNGGTFNGMPRLRVLSLRNNRMMSFPERAVKKLRGNIAVLDIDGNPLACTCGLLWLRAWLQEQSAMGPRCLDGTLLREIRLSRQECREEKEESEPLAPGCESEMLSGGNFEKIQSQQWMNMKEFTQNRTKAPLPEESEYFYDEYVDYPYNETLNEKNRTHLSSVSSLASHHTTGDTPVIYAASNKNKNKEKVKNPDTPKVVTNSPSSSGFTFFGLPLPNLNLNNLLGGTTTTTTRMDKPKILNAERKAAIVNTPIRLFPETPLITKIQHQTIDVDENPIRYHNFGGLNNQQIIGMTPPQVQNGGFVPLLPGTGGFTPIIPKPQRNYTVSIERVNVTELASGSSFSLSTIQPEHFYNSPSFLSKKPQNESFKEEILKEVNTIGPSIETTTENITSEEPEYEEDVEDEEYEIKESTARVTEITERFSTTPVITTTFPSTTSPPITTTQAFEDIFKETIDNVSLPPNIMTTTTTESLSNFKEKSTGFDLTASFTNNENKIGKDSNLPKKEVIGTPLATLLIPGGQQPQFRPSGRPSVTKVPNPNIAASLLEPIVETKIEDEDVAEDEKEEIVPLAHNREAKTTVLAEHGEDMSWYFANYNKTNLEPFVGNVLIEETNQGNLLRFNNLLLVLIFLFNI